MRRAVAGLLVVFCTGAGAEPAVTFPGPVTEARAPNSDMRVTYFAPGENAEGIHEYSLRLEYPGGRADQIAAFTRSVEVSWSPSGEAVAVTNFISANVADCYVITPGPDNTRKISLTEVLTKGRFPAPTWALQHSAHASVVCDGWAEPDKLRFVLEGIGEDAPRGFRYAFVYDLKRAAAKQERAPSKKGKPRR